MARLDEKNVSSVKKTVSVAAPTGGPLLKKLDVSPVNLNLIREYKKQRMGAGSQGKGGTLTKISTPIANAIKNKLNPAVQSIKDTLTSTPIVKKEELKTSTFRLPAVIQIGPHSYNREGVMDAFKKVESTYGKNSNKYKSLLNAVGGREENGKLVFYGREFKKPDLRKDAGKSYVDTAQSVIGNIPDVDRPTRSPYASYGRNANEISDKEAIDLLNQFGVKGERSLEKDKAAVRPKK